MFGLLTFKEYNLTFVLFIIDNLLYFLWNMKILHGTDSQDERDDK